MCDLRVGSRVLHLLLCQCLFPAAHCLSLLEHGKVAELLGRSSLIDADGEQESAPESLPLTMASASASAAAEAPLELEAALQQLLGPGSQAAAHAGALNLSVLPRCRSSLARHVALELVLALCSPAPGAAHNLHVVLDTLLELHHARLAPDQPPAPAPDHPEQLAPIRLSDWEVRTRSAPAGIAERVSSTNNRCPLHLLLLSA